MKDGLRPPIDERAPFVSLIESRLDRQSDAFARNAERMRSLVSEYRERLESVREGGGPDATAKHRKRGKLTARERVDELIDRDSAFLEFSALAAYEMYGGDSPSAGIVTGIGCVEGQQCVIVANDATVKGGTYYPMTVIKHLRGARDRRAESFAVHLPCRFRRRVSAAAGRRVP